ncbi:MAG: LysR family transcriptional regulator [Oceanospirillaceae bacterium]
MKKLPLGQICDFELKQLKIFKAVTDCGGFSAAENELNISRPTISNHIATLESRLNLVLCKRGRGGFTLTKEGEVVYEQTCKLLEQLEQAGNIINNLGERPAGKLRIAISDTFSTDLRCKLPEIYRKYYQQAPDVELLISVEHMTITEQKVLNNQLDVAMIPYHHRLEGLNYIHLFTDDTYVYCGNQHALFDMEDLNISDKMINESKLIHAGLDPHDEVYSQLSQMNPSGSSYFYESRIALLLSGCFIAFLPEEVAKPYVEKGLLKPIAKDRRNFRLGVAVISKKTIQQNRARDLFLDVIKKIHMESEAPY